jgi:hypothetical protein
MEVYSSDWSIAVLVVTISVAAECDFVTMRGRACLRIKHRRKGT